MFRLLLSALVALALLGAVACSDDDDAAEADTADSAETGGDPDGTSTDDLPIGTEDDLREALAASISSQTGLAPFDDETTDCLVDGIIDSIGYDRLIELGVRPGNVDDAEPLSGMTEDEQRAYVDALAECTSIRDLVVQSFGLGPPLDQCVADSIVDEDVAKIVLLFVLSDTDPTAPPPGAVANVFDSLQTCQSELVPTEDG